jgi:sigma-B regulation protein RsbU (phosphoserine phosphatase)
MYPSKIVGGDYYDLLSLPSMDTGLLIGDVCGKGVSAGLLMAAVGATLRAEAPRAASPDELLRKVNEIVLATTAEGRYASLFFASIAPDVMLLEYSNGGHPAPILYRPESGEIHWLEKGGPVVGLLANQSYDRGSVPLRAGDILVLYTDGLTEATNAEDEEYSQARLVSFLTRRTHRAAMQILEDLVSSVMDFHGGESLDDDMTVVVVKVAGDPPLKT